MTLKRRVFVGENFVLLRTTKAESVMDSKDKSIKEKWEDLRAEVALHAPFDLTGQKGDNRKKMFDVRGRLGLVQALVWVIC
jgi:hypothetical protein